MVSWAHPIPLGLLYFYASVEFGGRGA